MCKFEVIGSLPRMLTREKFEQLPKTTVPEVLRCDMNGVILQLLAVGVKDVEKFDFLERPPKDAIDSAFRLLKLLGAVDGGGLDGVNLTDLGKKLSAFPIAPKFAKAILTAKDLGCTEEVVTIVAILSGESILITPVAKREEALVARKKFASSEGDYITYLKIFRAFKSASNQKEWCKQNYVSFRQMRFAVEVRKQLMELCRKEGIPVQSAVDQTELVRKAFAQGLFTNVARLTKEGTYVTLDSHQKVGIHPSSVMFQTKPEVVIFTELVATQKSAQKSYMRDLCLADARWLTEAQPEYFRQHRLLSQLE